MHSKVYDKISTLYIDSDQLCKANKSRSTGNLRQAMEYSLIVTAKKNKLKVYDYLVYLLKRIPAGGFEQIEDWAGLMPWSEALPDVLRIK